MTMVWMSVHSWRKQPITSVHASTQKWIRRSVQWWTGCRHWRKRARSAQGVDLHHRLMDHQAASQGQRYLRLPTWKSRSGVLFEIQRRLVWQKAKQENWSPSYDKGLGRLLDSLMARVGAMRVRKTKIICCYFKNPSLSNCKQIREAMCAYIEKENIKLRGATLYVIEEKPVWRQEQQRTFGKSAWCCWASCKEQRKTYTFRNGSHSIKCTSTNRRLRNQFFFYQRHRERQWWTLKENKCWEWR